MKEPVKPVIAHIRSALKEGMARLRAAQVPSHTLVAEVLLLDVLGRNRTWLYTHSEEAMDPTASGKFFALIARRAAGEPTQYLTGRQEFWGLEFEVSPAVLIPRPETEHVVEVALERVGPRGMQIDTPSAALRVADVGTGSGCLAVALARELPHAIVVATDISAAALELARRNAARHRVSDRIHFLHTNLLEDLLHPSRLTDHQSRPFHLIVSNPPYIASHDVGLLEREVRDHEPSIALAGGKTGVEIYARLTEQASQLLAPGGVLVLELGYGAADQVRGMLQGRSGWVNISIMDDLAGIPRVLAAERVRG
jgi:release factor glutamine methyltransferase